jgi:hypothetical protein
MDDHPSRSVGERGNTTECLLSLWMADNASDSDQGETNPVHRRDGAGEYWMGMEIPDAPSVKPQPSFPFVSRWLLCDPWHNDAFVGQRAKMMGDGPREKQIPL